jgi:hypothetical protein
MIVDTFRFRGQIAHLHTLGPRAIAEILVEIAAQADCASIILGLLAEYEERLTPDQLRAVGGDRFPRRVPLLVPR